MTTLETAKALKEAGWDKETIHFQYLDNYTIKLYLPSLEELLAVMPCYTKLNNEYYFNLCKSIDNKRYYAEYRDNSQDVMMFKDELLQTTDPDPTEAVAQLWLKLRKEGIV